MVEVQETLNSIQAVIMSGGVDFLPGQVAHRLDEPHFLMTLLLAALIGLTSRSVLVATGSGVWAVIGLYLISKEAPGTAPYFSGAIIASELLVLSGLVLTRKRVKRLRQATQKLEKQMLDLQAKLDREILWRTAADELK